MGNPHLEKRNFVTARFVAFVEQIPSVKIVMNSAAQRREERETFRHSQNTEVCGDVRLLWDRSCAKRQIEIHLSPSSRGGQ